MVRVIQQKTEIEHGISELIYEEADASCGVYRNTDQGIGSSAWNNVDWDSEEWDTSNMHDPITNPSRITVPKNGRHIVIANISWALNALGVRGIAIFINNVLRATKHANPVNDVESSLSIQRAFDLTAGDYIEIRAYQNTGSDLNINGDQSKTWCNVLHVIS